MLTSNKIPSPAGDSIRNEEFFKSGDDSMKSTILSSVSVPILTRLRPGVTSGVGVPSKSPLSILDGSPHPTASITVPFDATSATPALVLDIVMASS